MTRRFMRKKFNYVQTMMQGNSKRKLLHPANDEEKKAQLVVDYEVWFSKYFKDFRTTTFLGYDTQKFFSSQLEDAKFNVTKTQVRLKIFTCRFCKKRMLSRESMLIHKARNCKSTGIERSPGDREFSVPLRNIVAIGKKEVEGLGSVKMFKFGPSSITKVYEEPLLQIKRPANTFASPSPPAKLFRRSYDVPKIEQSPSTSTRQVPNAEPHSTTKLIKIPMKSQPPTVLEKDKVQSIVKYVKGIGYTKVFKINSTEAEPKPPPAIHNCVLCARRFLSAKLLAAHTCHKRLAPASKKVVIVKNAVEKSKMRYMYQSQARRAIKQNAISLVSKELQQLYTNRVFSSTSKQGSNLQISQLVLPKRKPTEVIPVPDPVPKVKIKKEILSEDEQTFEPLKGIENMIKGIPETHSNQEPTSTPPVAIKKEIPSDEEEEETIESVEPLKGIEDIIKQLPEAKNHISNAQSIKTEIAIEPLKGIEDIVRQLPEVNTSQSMDELSDGEETIEQTIIEYVKNIKTEPSVAGTSISTSSNQQYSAIEKIAQMEQKFIPKTEKFTSKLIRITPDMMPNYASDFTTSDSSQDDYEFVESRRLNIRQPAASRAPLLSYKCVQCPKLLFMQQQTYKDHLMNHYRTGSFFTCDMCGKVVKTFFHLGTHMAMAHDYKLL